MSRKVIEVLREMGACAGPGDAIPWVLSRPESERDLASLWRDCPRADWMLWLVRRCNRDVQELRAVAWACAHLAQAYAVGADGHRATLASTRVARDAYADDAAARAAANAAADAADAARTVYAAAAYADDAAAYADDAYADDADAAAARAAANAAANAAADAADAAAYADAANAAAARTVYAAAQKDCADMVRLLVTCPVLPE